MPFIPFVFELNPDVDHKTGLTLTSITGNFRTTSSPAQDKWSWSSAWPTGTWYMYGSTTSPISGSVNTVTNAQKFNGSATSISPSGSGTSYRIFYQGVRVGHVFINVSGSTSQWYMYQTTYTPSGPYLPTPTDTHPLEFVVGSAASGTGWKGQNI